MSNFDTGQGYKIGRIIGQGAMGVVYEAWDERLNRRIALKLLHQHLTSDQVSVSRIRQEAQLAARIEHPNVVRVYSIKTIDDQLAIEMQFIDASPLCVLLSSGAIPATQAVHLFGQILEALGACHEQQVIHCDLKPGNLLVTPGGHVYLTDFGISRGTCEAGTKSDALWGTPRYCPPEAWKGGAPTIQWDIYAAGAIFIEVLTGNSLYGEQKNRQEVSGMQVENLAAQLLEPLQLSPALRALLVSLVEKEPANRPDSARSALHELRATPEYHVRDEETQPISNMQTPSLLKEEIESSPLKAGKGPRLIIVGILLLLCLIGIAALTFAVKFSMDKDGRPLETFQAAGVSGETWERLGESIFMRGDLYYAYDDGIHGMELWCNRLGSTESVLVADLNPGAEPSNPHRFMMRNTDDFLLAATTSEYGEELYLCHDHADIRLVKDIIPGSMGSEPQPMAAYENLMLFYATSLGHGRELWCTNTREAQTGLVRDLSIGRGGSIPMNPRLFSDGRYVYFVAYGGGANNINLWRFDFESLAVSMISEVAENTVSFGKLGSKVLLENSDQEHGNELWINESDQLGVKLLVDINPGPESSNPSQFITWNNVLLFQAYSKGYGNELWRSDGTVEGTHLLADINPGAGDSKPYGFRVAGEYVFFRALDDAHGKELWMTDGQSGGTRFVADISPGADSSDPYNIVAQGEHLFFTAYDGVHGEELWMLDVQEPETSVRLLADVVPGPASSEAHGLIFSNIIYGVFQGFTPEKTEQLYTLTQQGDKFVVGRLGLPGQMQTEGVSP